MVRKGWSWTNLLFVMIVAVMVSMMAPLRAHAVVGLGQQQFEIGSSTPLATVVLIAPGTSGNFVGITIASGAAGGWCDVFDSSATTNVALSGDGKSTAPPSRRIFTLLVAATNTTTTSPGHLGGPFTNGIAVICNALTRAIIAINQ